MGGGNGDNFEIPDTVKRGQIGKFLKSPSEKKASDLLAADPKYKQYILHSLATLPNENLHHKLSIQLQNLLRQRTSCVALLAQAREKIDKRKALIAIG